MKIDGCFKIIVTLVVMVTQVAQANAQGLVEDWLKTVQATEEVKILDKQIKDFKEYKGAPNDAVLYEPTGEKFMNSTEIKSAIPTKEKKLKEMQKLLIQFS